MNKTDEVFQAINDLETLLARSPGFVGKMLVDTEEVFVCLNTLRTKLNANPPNALRSQPPLQTHRSSRDLISWAQMLSREEKQEVIAALLED